VIFVGILTNLKKEARVVGFDDAPFRKGIDHETLVVGTIYRGGQFMDGVISTHVKVDGHDATRKISEIVVRTKFYPQLQAILLDGIAVGGFNVIDIWQLHEKTKLPIIVVIRDYPDYEKIEAALVKIGMRSKINLLRKAGEPEPVDEIFIQCAGCSQQEADKIVRLTSTHSHIPEPLRAAHLIAGGVTRGESKGRA